MSTPEEWWHDVAAELVRVELAGGGDEVDDRLRRIDAHHDPDVAELEIEVDQQRAALERARVGAGETGRERRLADAALGREDRDDAALATRAGLRRGLLLRARGVVVEHVGAAQREHERLGQLGQDGHVLHAVCERLLEELRRAARRHDHDRGGAGGLQRVDVLGREAVAAARAVEEDIDLLLAQAVACARSVDGRADHLDGVVRGERLANLRQAGARAGDEDANGVGHCVAPAGLRRPLISFCTAAGRPSPSTV